VVSVTEIVTIQSDKVTEMSNPQPKEQSIISNFSQPLLSIILTITAGAVLNNDGGKNLSAGGITPVFVIVPNKL
jgi:hypothetical protein